MNDQPPRTRWTTLLVRAALSCAVLLWILHATPLRSIAATLRHTDLWLLFVGLLLLLVLRLAPEGFVGLIGRFVSKPDKGRPAEATRDATAMLFAIAIRSSLTSCAQSAGTPSRSLPRWKRLNARAVVSARCAFALTMCLAIRSR